MAQLTDTTAAKSTVAKMIDSVRYTLSPSPQISIKLIARKTDHVRGIICNHQVSIEASHVQVTVGNKINTHPMKLFQSIVTDYVAA